MDEKLLAKVIALVDESFGEKQPHFERTIFWLLQLKPEADVAEQIAAYAHDIQRALAGAANQKRIENSDNGFKDPDYLAEHQNTGADVIRKFLTEQQASPELAEKVAHLISKHEIGGDSEQNLLKDADSISYFDCNALGFATKYAPIMGVAKVKAKFDWMFDRITAPKAKALAEPMYLKALAKLAE